MQNQNSQANKGNHDDVCEIYHPHEDSIERAKKHILVEEEYTDLSEFFKIFGNPTRLKIISLLSYEDLCVCDICEALELNQNAVSNQLRILRAHNIVKFEKEGKQARYSLTDLHVEMIYKMGLEHLNE
jgi:DNA-binding transcriptional ArsR family regulator